jgi:hypothetical protein
MNQLSAMKIHRGMDQDHTIVCDLMGLQRNPHCVLQTKRKGCCWELERERLRWVAMKWGLEIREHHSLETHLNLISDFAGSRERMSVITPFGRRCDMEEESGYSQSQWWREEMKSAVAGSFITWVGWRWKGRKSAEKEKVAENQRDERRNSIRNGAPTGVEQDYSFKGRGRRLITANHLPTHIYLFYILNIKINTKTT